MNKEKTPNAFRRKLTGALSIILMTAAAWAPTSFAATKGLYVGNEFYPPDAATETLAKQSGFNTLFLFTLNVLSNGDVQYNGTLIATNGTYVGNSTWGSRLAAVKNDGRVNRIELCIGSWGSTAFNSIRDLVSSQGTGSSSILYRNFLAIKNATGIDAIQYDDELTYDASSAVAFGNMLAGLGVKVTLCPYTNPSFWQSVKSQLGNKVDAIYLQCYDGGAGNNPGTWNTYFGGFKVYPGLWGNTDTPSSATRKIRDWQEAYGIGGGFLWLNGLIPSDAKKWGQALSYGLDPLPFFMIVNKNSGKAMDLISGNTANEAAIRQYDYSAGPNQRWALTPTDDGHFKIFNWAAGKCASVANNSSGNGAVIWSYEYGDAASQKWDLVDAGVGCFLIRNVGSGLYLEVAGGSTATNATIQQYAYTNTDAQKWRLNPYGNYYIHSALSGKILVVQGGGSANGSRVVQYQWQTDPWAKWAFNNEFDGWYSVQTLNAGGKKVISVINSSASSAEDTHIWDYNPSDWGAQRSRLWPRTDGSFSLYFSHTGMAWDIQGASSNNDVPLQQYPNNESTAQRFWLERVQNY
jgi:hypothetical protein